jgi:NAD(P)-dependent dehydrogenase (short-subunit alcohol dehydrogenase family)
MDNQNEYLYRAATHSKHALITGGAGFIGSHLAEALLKLGYWVTIIDDLNPDLDSSHLQLSNFGLLEDREKQTIELYLTRIGERGGESQIWDSDTYRYTIRFLK